MNPWVVILAADDGTLSVVGPFAARHRAENWTEHVDGEATAVMLESPADARAELASSGRWAPPSAAARRARRNVGRQDWVSDGQGGASRR